MTTTTTYRTADDVLTEVESRIQRGFDAWAAGQMTSPDDRDHFIDADRVLAEALPSYEQHETYDDLDPLANELYEVGDRIGETRDLATYTVARLLGIGVSPDTRDWDNVRKHAAEAIAKKLPAPKPMRMPPRGYTRVTRMTPDAGAFRLTVPSWIGRLVDPDQLFKIELTDEGILYRPVADAEGPVSSSVPLWLARAR